MSKSRHKMTDRLINQAASPRATFIWQQQLIFHNCHHKKPFINYQTCRRLHAVHSVKLCKKKKNVKEKNCKHRKTSAVFGLMRSENRLTFSAAPCSKLSHLAKYTSDRPLYSPLFHVFFPAPTPVSKSMLPDGENIRHVSLKRGDKEKRETRKHYKGSGDV